MKKICACLVKILGLSLLIALPLAVQASANNFTYYVNDAVGSPVVAMNQAGDVIWRKTYQPYGKASGKDGDNRVGYTGHIEDKPDLVCAGARYYDPDLVRFLSDDPVRFTESNPMSFNRYAYANNNPYRFVDPDGRNGVTAFGGLLYETAQFVSGNGFNASNIGGALVDGYNGEGSGFAASAFEDATSFIPIATAEGAVAKSLPLLRQGYVKAVSALGPKANAMLWAGKGEEQVARVISAERRAIGEAYKAMTEPGKLAEIYARNLEKYGDKLGPTVDFLREKGKSFQQIIESAGKAGGKDMGY